MKNRSNSNIGSSSTSSSIHGVSNTSTMNNNAAAIGNINTTTTTATVAPGSNSFRNSDEYNDYDENSNKIESQGLLNEINDTSNDMSNRNNNNNNNKTSNVLPISILFLSSIVLFYIGWYGPRQLMDRYIDDIIGRNIPPYQKITTTTDSRKQIIILDATYNHPVIDPPTISCK